MNTAELRRVSFRMRLFQFHGLDLDRAEALAFDLADRDRERDDRRLCMECQNLRKTGSCTQHADVQIGGYRSPFLPVRDVLHRCDKFIWRTPA